MQIVSPEERLKQQPCVKGVIFGETGVGKTSLVLTLPPEETLILNMEAGLLAIDGFPATVIDIKSWEDAVDISVLLNGADESANTSEDYNFGLFHSQQAAERNRELLEALVKIGKPKHVFIDSITELSRLSMSFAEKHPSSISKKTGERDGFAVYGLHGKNMINLFKRYQHGADMNVWFVGILDSVKDDFNRQFWQPQIEGAKPGRELPGIFDQVITMAIIKGENAKYRALVCHTENQWGYPAKDRSGTLDLLEEPDLSKLQAKIRAGARKTKYQRSIGEGE